MNMTVYSFYPQPIQEEKFEMERIYHTLHPYPAQVLRDALDPSCTKIPRTATVRILIEETRAEILRCLDRPLRILMKWAYLPPGFYVYIDAMAQKLSVTKDLFFEFEKDCPIDDFMRSDETSMDVVSFSLHPYAWAVPRGLSMSLRSMFELIQYAERIENWMVPVFRNSQFDQIYSEERLRDFWFFFVQLYMVWESTK